MIFQGFRTPCPPMVLYKDIYICGKIDQVASLFGLQHIITLGLTNVNIRKRTFYPLIKFTCQINLRQDENHANLI